MLVCLALLTRVVYVSVIGYTTPDTCFHTWVSQYLKKRSPTHTRERRIRTDNKVRFMGAHPMYTCKTNIYTHTRLMALCPGLPG